MYIESPSCLLVQNTMHIAQSIEVKFLKYAEPAVSMTRSRQIWFLGLTLLVRDKIWMSVELCQQFLFLNSAETSFVSWLVSLLLDNQIRCYNVPIKIQNSIFMCVISTSHQIFRSLNCRDSEVTLVLAQPIIRFNKWRLCSPFGVLAWHKEEIHACNFTRFT